jgi:hypothetical protein
MAVAPAELIEQLAPRSERRVVAGLLAFAVALRIALLFVGYVQTEISRGNPGKNDVQPTREAFSEAIARLDFADPGWYKQIAQDGYARRAFTTERQENWGFFPGWPLMMRMGAPFLGGAAQAARILANLASFAALVLLFQLLRLDYSVGVSTVATAALCASPYAYHLMRPGPEGAFFLFTVASLLAARRERLVLAGTMGAVAVLVRPPGLFLFPALLVLVANEAKGDARSWPWPKIARRSLPVLLIPAALAGYMLYMRSIIGNAFAYFDMQRANWGQRAQYPLVALLRWVGAALRDRHLGLGPDAVFVARLFRGRRQVSGAGLPVVPAAHAGARAPARDAPGHRRRLHRPADLPLHKPIVVPDLGRVRSLRPRMTTPSL